MARTPSQNKFTLENVRYLLKDRPDMTGKELANALGVNFQNVARLNFYKWRRLGKVNFYAKKGDIYGIDILYFKDKGVTSELLKIKNKLYVEDVVNMRDIANNPAIKAAERIKATEVKQRALRNLENAHALNLLKAYGLDPEDE